MEYLRWILLLVGILFVLVLYLLGRHRRRERYVSEFDNNNELPEISADSWDDLDEAVGAVRVVARDHEQVPRDALVSDHPVGVQHEASTSAKTSSSCAADTTPPANDLISLYLISRSGELIGGDIINSSAYANGLTFGDMNIYHRLDEFEQPLYSMANMMKPGSFDADTMHQLKTRGLVMFIQLARLKNPVEALHDMLRCAYRMAEMIDAQLCNQQREPLTEQDANAYRELAARFDEQS